MLDVQSMQAAQFGSVRSRGVSIVFSAASQSGWRVVHLELRPRQSRVLPIL